MTWPLAICVRTLKPVTSSVSGPQDAVIFCSHGGGTVNFCTVGCDAVKPMFPRNMPSVSSDSLICHAREFLQVGGWCDSAIGLLCSFFFFLYRYILNCSLLYSLICPFFFSGRTDILLLFLFCLNIRPLRHIRSPGIVVICNNILY